MAKAYLTWAQLTLTGSKIKEISENINRGGRCIKRDPDYSDATVKKHLKIYENDVFN